MKDLKLTCGNAPVNNAIKVSWMIMNTGSMGISEFETLPALIFPEELSVISARISGTSHLLKINRKLSVGPKSRTISIKSLGVFNPGDFFEIDVYIINAPGSIESGSYFGDWKLVAKSVDLKVKRDLTCKDRHGLQLVQY